MEHPPASTIDDIELDMSKFQPAVSFGTVVQQEPIEPNPESQQDGPSTVADFAFEGELPSGPLTVDQVAALQEPPTPRPARRQAPQQQESVVVPDFMRQAQSNRPMTETQKKAEAAVFTQATKGLINQQNKAKEDKNKKINDADSDEKRRYDKYVQCCRYLRFFAGSCPADRVPANAREEVYDKFITHVREQQDSANLLENAKGTASFAVQAIEQGGSYFGFRLSGPRKSLAESFTANMDMFESEIAEMAILYPFLFQRPLWIRMIQKLGALAFMVHKINSTNAEDVAPSPAHAERDPGQRPMPTDLKDKYKDL